MVEQAERPPRLLIANRGEIALRIIRTANKLNVHTIAIYTLADSSSPHVHRASEAHQVGDGSPREYLNIEAILAVAKETGATMIAPGYGFLSENEAFARAVEKAGIVFLGPTPEQIDSMGLKHEARAIAQQAGVPVVPGSDGLVATLQEAIPIAQKIGYPVMIKASGGGGGMGIVACKNEAALVENFEATQAKGLSLFKNSACFLERYVEAARHVEVQVFGNGEGHVVDMGERECSVQRRHQKVVEEAPCALFATEDGKAVRTKMCKAARDLCSSIKYRSAGTVEFIMDPTTLEFFFLELNARIQVEHPITEATHPGLDLVELMIRQGMKPTGALSPSELNQADFATFHGHAIEARVYCESPVTNFTPSPGLLHHVSWADLESDGGRVETWVETGTMVTPNYDPMIAKLIVAAPTRGKAIAKMALALRSSKIVGPPTNLDYLHTIVTSPEFASCNIHTTFLETFAYRPSAFQVLAPGLSSTVQDLPGRLCRKGITRAGPADQLSHRAANILVGNDEACEALEVTMLGPKLLFHQPAIVAVTGCPLKVTVNDTEVPMWAAFKLEGGDVLHLGTATTSGLRAYLAIKGGMPNVSVFMGSKSTFEGAGLGGYLGRALLPGDLVDIAPLPADTDMAVFDVALPPSLQLPLAAGTWHIEVAPGAQWSHEYLTPEAMEEILGGEWKVTPASNRSGLRLDGPPIKWARKDGGQGGGHPSNLIDQAYSFGALNVNGDTPVLFGVDAPDMGGYVTILTVLTPSLWKLGQVRAGDTIKFVGARVEDCEALERQNRAWLGNIRSAVAAGGKPLAGSKASFSLALPGIGPIPSSSTLHHQVASPRSPEIHVRQAGDEFVLLEMGEMELDIEVRLRVEAWERKMGERDLEGVVTYNTSIRSCLVHFDPSKISMEELCRVMVATAAEITDVSAIELDIQVIRLPVVVDDKWTQEAVEFYQRTVRQKAVYLPTNTDYVNRNNGLDANGVADALLKTPWLVLALGFFVQLPFIIPLDPRRRILASKYNPSRTKTPEGAIGLAGVIGSIYPIASAGGYQLLGRTLSTWNSWAADSKHSIVSNFDQIEFFAATEDDFVKIEADFKAGRYKPEVRQSKFVVAEYLKMAEDLAGETAAFRKQQLEASERLVEEENALYAEYLKEKAEAAKSGTTTSGVGSSSDGTPVVSFMAATVYKLLLEVGDEIKDDEQKVVELEAMKTSVFLTAGAGSKGKKLASFACAPGDAVAPGQTLAYIA